MSDTIHALATAPGKAGVSIIRISGPNAFEVLDRLGGGNVSSRMASLRVLIDGNGDTLDHALVLTFAAGASFTDEDVVELHLHGSIAVQRAMLKRLDEIGQSRLATPGEFTKRALLNGRMNLTEVQGLADLIEAETEEQRRAGMQVLEGAMAERIDGWRTHLIRAAALMEATIDFADEEVPVDVLPEVSSLLNQVLPEITRELDGFSAARSLKEGFEVAIVGAPNVGKSSLLNAIARCDVALVSDIPGTTRDVIERSLDLHGLPVVFIDTAGIRETDDPIERLGVGRAKERASRADLRLFLHDEGDGQDWPIEPKDRDIIVRTKSDLHGHDGVSAMSGDGISKLLDTVAERLGYLVRTAGFVNRDRDRRALSEAQSALFKATEDCASGEVEIVAYNVRSAVQHLGRIIGRVGVEDVLDDVFSSFCLGK